MTNGHNHPPRCCCPPLDHSTEMHLTCPACVEHGELAQLAASPNDCPSCHTTAGHPHTDYCQLPDECGDVKPHPPHIRFDGSARTCPGRLVSGRPITNTCMHTVTEYDEHGAERCRFCGARR